MTGPVRMQIDAALATAAAPALLTIGALRAARPAPDR
jgi:hypothetical protein